MKRDKENKNQVVKIWVAAIGRLTHVTLMEPANDNCEQYSLRLDNANDNEPED